MSYKLLEFVNLHMYSPPCRNHSVLNQTNTVSLTMFPLINHKHIRFREKPAHLATSNYSLELENNDKKSVECYRDLNPNGFKFQLPLSEEGNSGELSFPLL